SVHVLRRPPELVAVAVEPRPPDAAGARPKGTSVRHDTGVPGAAARPDAEEDGCNGGPEPLAFR
ncbi:MAG TPA: hypothetical protein VJ722_02145, partial [Rhodanobacteraceae bacterium]|nr:hypothetical protein [Rhodanobacteraceae bacterium]